MDNVKVVGLPVESLLDELRINSADFLDDLLGRSICSKCGKSRKYFCYTCYIAVDDIADRIPTVKLPIKIDIVKHPHEVDGKSTASHAGVIASEDVSIYTYPYFPNYEDKSKLLLVFPGKNAKTLEQITHLMGLKTTRETTIESTADKSVVLEKCLEDLSLIKSPCIEEAKKRLRSRFPFEKIILIDSTWNQVRAIRNDARLQGIVKLELVERETLFWRFQRGKPRTYLSTIEAVYYVLVDIHTLFIESSYLGEYDNLLFFFKYMFRKINSLYRPDQLRVNRPLAEFPVRRKAAFENL